MNNQTEIGQLLREVSRLHSHLQQMTVECCGTSTAQCHTLIALGEHGEITMAALVKLLALDKGWVSRTVDGLAQEGLIDKRPSDTDRRTIVLSLTKAGKQRYHELNDTLNALSGRVMERIADNQHNNVRSVLEQLKAALIEETHADPALVPLDKIK